MLFSSLVPDFFKVLPVVVCGTGGLGVTLPVAYVAGSSPNWATSWSPSLSVSEPILDCIDRQGIDFKVYLFLDPQEMKNELHKVIFGQVQKGIEKGGDYANTYTDLDWAGYSFNFGSTDQQVTITIKHGGGHSRPSTHKMQRSED